MKVGDLVVYRKEGEAKDFSGVGIIQDEGSWHYFIYWSGFPHNSMIAVRKSVVRLANESR